MFFYCLSAIMQTCWHCNLMSADRLLVDFVGNFADRSNLLWRYRMVSLVEIGSKVYQQGAWCIPYNIYHWFDKNFKTAFRVFKGACFALPCCYRCLNFLSHACVRQRCICVQMQVGMRHSHLLKRRSSCELLFCGNLPGLFSIASQRVQPNLFLTDFLFVFHAQTSKNRPNPSKRFLQL